MKNLTSRTHFAIYILLVLVLCVGCMHKKVSEDVEVDKPKSINFESRVNLTFKNKSTYFRILTIDSCEYIYYNNGNATKMAATATICHKGNCKYCVKRALGN